MRSRARHLAALCLALLGLSLYLQAWCVDAGGSQGVSASNALALTSP